MVLTFMTSAFILFFIFLFSLGVCNLPENFVFSSIFKSFSFKAVIITLFGFWWANFYSPKFRKKLLQHDYILSYDELVNQSPILMMLSQLFIWIVMPVSFIFFVWWTQSQLLMLFNINNVAEMNWFFVIIFIIFVSSIIAAILWILLTLCLALIKTPFMLISPMSFDSRQRIFNKYRS